MQRFWRKACKLFCHNIANAAHLTTIPSDAIALNIGSDSWQLARIQDAYDAAVGTNLKLFISFDYTAFPCSVSSTISYVQKFSSHSNQFLVNGKPMISSYSGDCLGTDGWKNVKSSTNGYLMPFIWGIESTMGTDWSFLDSWYWYVEKSLRSLRVANYPRS